MRWGSEPAKTDFPYLPRNPLWVMQLSGLRNLRCGCSPQTSPPQFFERTFCARGHTIGQNTKCECQGNLYSLVGDSPTLECEAVGTRAGGHGVFARQCKARPHCRGVPPWAPRVCIDDEISLEVSNDILRAPTSCFDDEVSIGVRLCT